ncbi:MAG: Ni/Fe hydrogenase subunit alpha [Candidatus Helarchaeota archaeon]
MSKTIKIDPVTRLEGHGAITIKLGPGNKVEDVQYNITSTRFFEKWFEGRKAEDVPRMAPRICGICPIPHHLASTKAVEAAFGITPPRPALKLRELMINAKQISSHVLHIAALQLPDLLVGPFAPKEKRNVVTVINALPDIGKAVFEAMRFGQELCASIGGKSVHPVSAIAGGMTSPWSEEKRDQFLKAIPRVVEIGKVVVDLGNKLVQDYLDVITKVGNVPTYYFGLVNDKKEMTIWDGNLRVMAPDGKIVVDEHPSKYLEFLGEHIPNYSYATHIYYKGAGYPDGIWRANCLARLNVAEKMQTPWAQELLEEFRKTVGRPCHLNFAYVWARIIETIQAVEKCKILMEDPEIVSTDVKLADVEPKAGVGVGCVEAPRGNLIHNYWTNDKGIVTKANLVVATNNNIAGIQKSLLHVAKQVFEDKAHESLKLPEPMIK